LACLYDIQMTIRL